jgi:hypothetical protein
MNEKIAGLDRKRDSSEKLSAIAWVACGSMKPAKLKRLAVLTMFLPKMSDSAGHNSAVQVTGRQYAARVILFFSFNVNARRN